ncbi:MAG: metallophosphoesterase [bacterium]
MRILTVTDLHEKRPALERILRHAGPVDVVLFGGDITDFGTPAAAEKLIRLAQASAAQIFAVAGNCDSAEIERHLVELDVSLFERGRIFRGVGFQGLSAIPLWKPVMGQVSAPVAPLGDKGMTE